jgi:hypothetical protein
MTRSLSAEVVAKAGMADMAKKFIDMGAEIYVDNKKVKLSNRSL